jgi:hypothetical protein
MQCSAGGVGEHAHIAQLGHRARGQVGRYPVHARDHLARGPLSRAECDGADAGVCPACPVLGYAYLWWMRQRVAHHGIGELARRRRRRDDPAGSCACQQRWHSDAGHEDLAVLAVLPDRPPGAAVASGVRCRGDFRAKHAKPGGLGAGELGCWIGGGQKGLDSAMPAAYSRGSSAARRVILRNMSGLRNPVRRRWGGSEPGRVGRRVVANASSSLSRRRARCTRPLTVPGRRPRTSPMARASVRPSQATSLSTSWSAGERRANAAANAWRSSTPSARSGPRTSGRCMLIRLTRRRWRPSARWRSLTALPAIAYSQGSSASSAGLLFQFRQAAVKVSLTTSHAASSLTVRRRAKRSTAGE